MHFDPEGNRDGGEDHEVKHEVQREAAAPFDGIADAVEAAKKDEGGDADGKREENRERVRQLRRVGEESIHRAKFHGQPEQNSCRIVFPSAGRFAKARSEQKRGNYGVGCAGENEFWIAVDFKCVDEDGEQRKQRHKEAASRTESAFEEADHGWDGEKKFEGEQTRRDGQRDGEARTAKTQPDPLERREQNDDSPKGQRHHEADAPRFCVSRHQTDSTGRLPRADKNLIWRFRSAILMIRPDDSNDDYEATSGVYRL